MAYGWCITLRTMGIGGMLYLRRVNKLREPGDLKSLQILHCWRVKADVKEFLKEVGKKGFK